MAYTMKNLTPPGGGSRPGARLRPSSSYAGVEGCRQPLILGSTHTSGQMTASCCEMAGARHVCSVTAQNDGHTSPAGVVPAGVSLDEMWLLTAWCRSRWVSKGLDGGKACRKRARISFQASGARRRWQLRGMSSSGVGRTWQSDELGSGDGGGVWEGPVGVAVFCR